MFSKLPTWAYEQALVALILFLTVKLTKGGYTEYLGSLAVLFTFSHASISNRLTEKEALRKVPEVSCYKWSLRYFIGKEILWFIYFIVHKSWAALVGVILFLIYPVWRSYYRRKIKPLV
jgi:hypothetical protein